MTSMTQEPSWHLAHQLLWRPVNMLSTSLQPQKQRPQRLTLGLAGQARCPRTSRTAPKMRKSPTFFFSHKPPITSYQYHRGTTSSYTNGWKLTVHPAPQKRWHRWSWPWWPADTSIVQRTQKLCGRWSSQIGLKWVEHKCLKPPPIVL